MQGNETQTQSPTFEQMYSEGIKVLYEHQKPSKLTTLESSRPNVLFGLMFYPVVVFLFYS